MRRTLAGVLVLVLAVLVGCSTSPGPAPVREYNDTSFSDLKKEFDEVVKQRKGKVEEAGKAQKERFKTFQAEAQKEIDDAKTPEEKQKAEMKVKMMAQRGGSMRPIVPGQDPTQEFSKRFLAFGEKNPTDPSACESLVMAIRTCGGPNGLGVLVWNKAIAALRANHVSKPEIKTLLRPLAGSNDEAALDLVREVAAKNSEPAIQAEACKALKDALTQAIERAEGLKANPKQRERAESQLGKPRVEKMLASIEKNKQELDELNRTLKEKFGNLVVDLSVGKPAPEVLIEDLEGKKVKLSDLKGKVVVLDIWATWCPPCRGMIPHTRELVSKMKDKPFVFVSVSGDENKEDLVNFVKNNPMPWTHWWSGTGGMVRDWEVKAFPTIYILDHKGVIREKIVGANSPAIDRAVEKLLDEAADPTKG
jgi:thiol-disulfide isomerase/thioredoxin